jgi:hypothetical protein
MVNFLQSRASEKTPLLTTSISQPEVSNQASQECQSKTNSLKEFSSNPSSDHNVQQTSYKRKPVRRQMNGVAHYSLKDFDLLKVLGKGTYGKVC